MLGIILLLLTIILLLLFLLERRTIIIGGVFLTWAVTAIVFIIITLETYQTQVALIFALIVLAPFVLLFPFYFASLIILLLTSGLQLIKKEGKKLRNFLSIVLGIGFILWSVISRSEECLVGKYCCFINAIIVVYGLCSITMK